MTIPNPQRKTKAGHNNHSGTKPPPSLPPFSIREKQNAAVRGLHGHVVEEVADALAVVRPPDGLGEGARDVDDAQLGAPVDLVAEGGGVGHHEAAKDGAVDGVDGLAGEDTTGSVSYRELL